jgi:hypothetical protein
MVIIKFGVIWELHTCFRPEIQSTPNHEQETHSAKMGTVVWPENTQNAPTFFGPICLPKPKSLGFSEKSFLWVSVRAK